MDPENESLAEVEPMPVVLTKEDVCRILGVTESWLTAEVQSGRLPHIRLGKKKMIRFRPAHLEQYLSAREVNNDQTEAVCGSR